MTGPVMPADQITPAFLPKVRRDLLVDLAEDDRGALPSAIISDPVRGSYFKLPWPESGIFLSWQQSKSIAELGRCLHQNYGLTASPADISKVVDFAVANQLTETDASGSWQRYAGIQAAGKHGWLGTIMHGYLFFRMPLVRPEPWLTTMLPRLQFLYCKKFWIGIAAIASFGLYFAVRQWGSVVAATADALQMQSLALYGVAILALKGFHELGHALTTVRFGCHVPSMGIAVMLGTPVFYTDTSDSWRLSRKSERLAIVFAGVAAEAIIAAVAILLWSFLQDGMARSICFALSTASIALSIAVNLNPFMRYDGYFALSDYLEVPNLQPRAFGLGTWKLRELLFDLRHDPPEQLPERLQKTLILYAACTALYRLFLYLGIAALVYTFAGKAIGIVLGLFEVVFFILDPVARELMAWWKLRSEIRNRRRTAWTAAVSSISVVVMVVPWISTIDAPAVVVASKEQAIYLPFAARLSEVRVTEGQRVRAGDVLFAADASETEKNLEKASLELRTLAFQRDRLQSSVKELELSTVIESKLEQARENVAAIGRQKEQLVIRARFDGRITDLDSGISIGLWLNEKQPLARLVAEGKSAAHGMISDSDIARVREGATAVFVPDDAAAPSQRLLLTSISPAGDGSISEPVLADRHGGPVAADDKDGELIARQGYFDVTFAEFDHTTHQVMRGVAKIEAERISPAALIWRGIERVLVREQGF